MDYTGFYINLNRSIERREEIETQLVRFNLDKNYHRFAAADGNNLGFPNPKLLNGEMGCFISHYLLLKENLSRTTSLHIVEDDAIFCPFTGPAIRSITSSNNLSHYDIIYADSLISTSNVLYKKYKDLYDKSVRRDAAGQVLEADFNIIDVTAGDFATTASMIISQHAIKKLYLLYEEELAKGPQVPIDLFIRRKAQEGVLKIGCIFPFVTSVRLEHIFGTTLNEDKRRVSALAGAIARQTFFVDCDFNKCLEYANKYLSIPEHDLHAQVLMRVLGFSLDQRFKFE